MTSFAVYLIVTPTAVSKLQKREFFENSQDINFNNQNDKIDTKLNENIEQNIEQNNGLIHFNNANT